MGQLLRDQLSDSMRKAWSYAAHAICPWEHIGSSINTGAPNKENDFQVKLGYSLLCMIITTKQQCHGSVNLIQLHEQPDCCCQACDCGPITQVHNKQLYCC